MIKLLLLAVVPFMTEHRNVAPKTEVSTNFYGSVTGIVNNAYIQSHGGGGDGGGIDTNAVIDIANSTIATNPVVAAKIDGPTVAPTNTAEAAGKSADAKLTGIALTNRYTKAETDAKLAGKLNGPNDLGIVEAGAELDALILVGRDMVTTYGDIIVMNSDDTPIHFLSLKANRAEPSVAVINELATLDDDGNPTRSGIAANDVITTEGTVSGKFISGYLDFSNTGDDHIRGDPTGGLIVSTSSKVKFILSGGSESCLTPDGTPVVTEGSEAMSVKADRSMISATDPNFSNAVLAVGLNIDTNSVAVLNEIAATFGGFPIGGTATTVGGLLAALAAAIAWLKKNKVGSFASVGGASATVENGVAKLDDFFTESNSLLNGRLSYSRNATGLKDRAFNTISFDGTEFNLSTALEAVTPTASEQPRDLLIVATATAATTISFTAGTIKGDKPTIDGPGSWLITLTEYAANTWYCRQIKMEDAA